MHPARVRPDVIHASINLMEICEQVDTVGDSSETDRILFLPRPAGLGNGLAFHYSRHSYTKTDWDLLV